jgi:hypothetical protein
MLPDPGIDTSHIEPAPRKVTISEVETTGTIMGDTIMLGISAVPEVIAPPPDTVHLPEGDSARLRDEDYGMIGGNNSRTHSC